MSLNIRSWHGHASILNILTFAPLNISWLSRSYVFIKMFFIKLNNLFFGNFWFWFDFGLWWLFFPVAIVFIPWFLAGLSLTFILRYVTGYWSARLLMLETFYDMLYLVSVVRALGCLLLTMAMGAKIAKVCGLLNLVEILFSWSGTLKIWLVLIFFNFSNSITIG
jgi:hypothetical protein